MADGDSGSSGSNRLAMVSVVVALMAGEGAKLPKAEFDALFNEADKQFSAINDDCVRAAMGHLL